MPGTLDPVQRSARCRSERMELFDGGRLPPSDHHGGAWGFFDEQVRIVQEHEHGHGRNVPSKRTASRSLCEGVSPGRRELHFPSCDERRRTRQALCKLLPEWESEWEAVRAERLYDASLPRFGNELVRAVAEGRDEAWMHALCEVLERALEGMDETKNLVIVGSSSRCKARRTPVLQPPDALDARLGPLAQSAWSRLIEGWTGQGIRTIEHWKRGATNGPVYRVEWSAPQRAWLVERGTNGDQRVRFECRGEGLEGEGVLRDEHAEPLFACFRPLTATRLERFDPPKPRPGVYIARDKCTRCVGSGLTWGCIVGTTERVDFLVDRAPVEELWTAVLRDALLSPAQK